MMRLFLILISVLFSFSISAKTLKVAVIDSGFDFKKSAKLCKTGHIDLTNTTMNDEYGHGNNVVGLIEQNAGNSDYCIIIIKYYVHGIGYANVINFVAGLYYAQKVGADIINLSGGGYDPLEKEKQVITELLDKGVFIFSAAGNDHIDLDKFCGYYPACYDDRITIVGNKHYTSNFGKDVDIIVDGVNKEANGLRLTGTSQSTAIATGKFIKYVSKRRKHKD